MGPAGIQASPPAAQRPLRSNHGDGPNLLDTVPSPTVSRGRTAPQNGRTMSKTSVCAESTSPGIRSVRPPERTSRGTTGGDFSVGVQCD